MEGPVNGSNKVVKDDVDGWTQEFMQNYPVLMGDGKIQQKIWAGYGSTIGLPFNLIIDRATMTVKGHLGAPTIANATAMCDQP